MRDPETLYEVFKWIINVYTILFFGLAFQQILSKKRREITSILWGMAPFGFLFSVAGFATFLGISLDFLPRSEGGDVERLIETADMGAYLLKFGSFHTITLLILAGIASHVARKRRLAPLGGTAGAEGDDGKI